MIKNVIYLCLLLVLTTGGIADIMSNGAPASSTGAPGEASCTASGCHDDKPLNSGLGISAITVGSGQNEYIPGTTYTVLIDINQGTLNRFGFQLIALKDADNSNIGTFTVTQTGRTQVIPGYGSLSKRKYITYTYPGTNAVLPGNGQWSFEWTAPATDEGSITLYLATIAANNDGTDAGDYCYLKSLQLKSTTAGIEQLSVQKQFTLIQSSVNNYFKIHYALEKTVAVKLELYDINGSKLQEWENGMQASGIYDQELSFKQDYAKGIYFIKFIRNDRTLVKKFTLN